MIQDNTGQQTSTGKNTYNGVGILGTGCDAEFMYHPPANDT